jgi:glyoxylase-like metal-dependent hydrolase (beta-lactamase superfamily II)
VEGVSDAQTVEVGDLKVTAWAVAGHTAGSTAWLVNQTLFVGDAVTVKTPERVLEPPWVFSDDTGEAEASLRSLVVRLPITPELVVPSHTGAVSGAVFAKALGKP